MSEDLFIDLKKGKIYSITGGIEIKPIYYTSEFMAALFIINKKVPKHKHPNIQFGIILNGEALFKIGEEKKIVRKDMLYYVPSNVEHEVDVLKGPLYALDIFIPPREDYKKYFNK